MLFSIGQLMPFISPPYTNKILEAQAWKTGLMRLQHCSAQVASLGDELVQEVLLRRLQGPRPNNTHLLDCFVRRLPADHETSLHYS